VKKSRNKVHAFQVSAHSSRAVFDELAGVYHTAAWAENVVVLYVFLAPPGGAFPLGFFV